jgi:hypothetical protein
MTTVNICLSYINYIFSTFIFYTSFQARLYLFVIAGTEDGSLDLGLVHENNGKYICTVENGIRDRAGKYLYRQGEITVSIEGARSK